MRSTPDLIIDGVVIRYDADILPNINAGVFDVDFLRSNGFWLASTQGRSQAHFFTQEDREMVLRHFHRGGLVGRVNSDLFLRTAPHNSRGFREFDLLGVMHAKGLPVPRPVAARYVPAGLFYRADIITERIPTARPMADVMREKHLSGDVWLDVGAAIKTMHNHLIYHSDLNARNILIDADDHVWIIDFDKCNERTAGPWMQGNLDRLKRSLIKTKTQFAVFHWTEEDWENLLSGYNNTPQTSK